MMPCTICGTLCPELDEDNALCLECCELNFAGNTLAQEPSYAVYAARRGPPLILQAARLEHAQENVLNEWLEAVHTPPYIPYEPRHMIQAIESIEEARALFIEQMGCGDPGSLSWRIQEPPHA